jgi:flagellar hook-basal body complex protein FliE
MADEFKVDLSQLTSFGRVLKQSVTDLEEARSALSAVSADQIGTPRLDEACETFQNRWKYGTGQLKDMIKAVDEGVEKTALSYKQFEDNLAQALKKIKETNAANTGGK